MNASVPRYAFDVPSSIQLPTEIRRVRTDLDLPYSHSWRRAIYWRQSSASITCLGSDVVSDIAPYTRDTSAHRHWIFSDKKTAYCVKAARSKCVLNWRSTAWSLYKWTVLLSTGERRLRSFRVVPARHILEIRWHIMHWLVRISVFFLHYNVGRNSRWNRPTMNTFVRQK